MAALFAHDTIRLSLVTSRRSLREVLLRELFHLFVRARDVTTLASAAAALSTSGGKTVVAND